MEPLTETAAALAPYPLPGLSELAGKLPAMAVNLALHPGAALSNDVAPLLKGVILGWMGLPELAYHIILLLIIASVLAGCVSVYAFLTILIERRVCARFQNRPGPNRVGPQGLLQTVADALKMLQKEDIIPTLADKPLFKLAPFVAFIPVYMVLALLPFDQGFQVVDLPVGMLYITAVSGMGVLAIVMAGWSSANKYSLLGGLRSAAQVVSYELSPALVVLAVVLFSGNLSTQGIVQAQKDNWNLWGMPLTGVIGFLIYITASTAELNRAPFDLPESESELTAGYHTEYSGMRFGLFQMAEFTNMFIVAALATTMFLGGWQPLVFGGWQVPVLNLIPGWLLFLGKTYAIIFLLMWFRWTFPRVRVDQLMKLEWKILLPISFANLVLVAAYVAATVK